MRPIFVAITLASNLLVAAVTVATPIARAEEPPVDRQFRVDSSSSKVEFLMEAPIENIHGVAPRSVQGELTVNPKDLSKTRGQIRIDLDRLEVFQSKLDESTGAFAEETKSEKQNADMKAWFEISPDVPGSVRERNRWITFDIESVSAPSGNDISKLSGPERKAKARITGKLTLHGISSAVHADVNLSFKFKDDELTSIRVSSSRSVPVSLAQHDIRPRTAFEKLAAKTLGALGQKVADAAPITFTFTAVPQ